MRGEAPPVPYHGQVLVMWAASGNAGLHEHVHKRVEVHVHNGVEVGQRTQA